MWTYIRHTRRWWQCSAVAVSAACVWHHVPGAHAQPNFKPCAAVACADNDMRAMFQSLGTSSPKPAVQASPAATPTGIPTSQRGCPATREVLGQQSWTLVRSAARWPGMHHHTDITRRRLRRVACMHCSSTASLHTSLTSPPRSSLKQLQHSFKLCQSCTLASIVQST